jgi:hypothetical protein
MAEVKLELDRLSRPEKVALAKAIETAMTGNAAFATPDPPLSELATDYGALETGLETQTAAKVNYQEKTTALNPLEDTLDRTLTRLGAYVQLKSGGVAEVIQSAAMGVKSEGAPVTLGKVTAMAATGGDDATEADTMWDPLEKAVSYEGQCCDDPVTPTGWKHLFVTTKSKHTATGLESGKICWFRVRGVSANGPGPWSDPAMAMIP